MKTKRSLAALALIGAASAIASGDVTFRRFDEIDLPRLYEWVKAPHVAQWWWTDSDTYEKFVEEFHPEAHAKNFQTPFVVYCDGQPIGYAQYYRADKLCDECMAAYHNPTEGTFGLDVIIGDADREIGLPVDCVLGEEDVVIKSMAENYQNVTGIAGASILGDGRVSLILDTTALIDLSSQVAAHA